METKHMQLGLLALCFLCAVAMAACKSSAVPADTTTETVVKKKRLSPERVDIRGSIITSRYNQGQVILEVEGTPYQQHSRYYRAYVLVLPTTQIIGPGGRSISLSELHMGQNVAVLLRGGGRGNLEGLGIAHKVWVEDLY